ncbi:MAG: histone-lysine N-methyltransferase, partial [Desulfovibrio sp.]|nr:histone-lysine N-methyltransferase [Desulfovibrio sp.]
SLVQQHMPELFASEFDRMKKLAGELAANLILRLAASPALSRLDAEACAALDAFVAEYPFIQFCCLTDAEGRMCCSAIADSEYAANYASLHPGYDFSGREWFKMPMQTGDLHIMDVYQSHFTAKLVITVSCAVTDENDRILGVVSGDIQLEQLLKRARALRREADEGADGDDSSE